MTTKDSESPIIVAEEVEERRSSAKGRRINAEITWSALFPNADRRMGGGDRRQMSQQEFADLTAEAGHPFANMNAAHMFRRHKVIRQAVEEMLNPAVERHTRHNRRGMTPEVAAEAK